LGCGATWDESLKWNSIFQKMMRGVLGKWRGGDREQENELRIERLKHPTNGDKRGGEVE